MNAEAPSQDEGSAQAIEMRLRELDAQGTLELRRAYGVVAPLVQGLPGTDSFIIGPPAIQAWRTIRDAEPDVYLAYRGAVRQKARHVIELLDHLVGAPRRTLAREIVLYSPSDLCARQPAAQLVRGVLPATGIAVGYGDSGTGKSFFFQDLFLSIARGIRWRGRRVRQGGGVWIGAEGSNKARAEAYAKFHNVDIRELPVRYIEQPISLRGEDCDLTALLEKTAVAHYELGTIALTVVDTLNRTIGGGNESASEDMGEYLTSLAAIATATGGLVLVIHHAGKDSSRGARGHSSLRAASDAEIEVTRDAGGLRLAKVTKLRDGEDGHEFPFRLQVVDLGPHPDPDADDGERWNSCVVVPTDEAPGASAKPKRLPASAQVALDALRTAIGLHGEPVARSSTIPSGARAVRLEQWQTCFESTRPLPQDLSAAEARSARNARRMAFQRAMDQLQAARLVGGWEGFWWIRA